MSECISSNLTKNIEKLKQILPISASFDLITRDLYFGETKAYWIGINGFCDTDLLQKIFSDLQNPKYIQGEPFEDLTHFMDAKIGYAQVQTESDWDILLKNLLSGPSLLFVDGCDKAVIIDTRTYPTRGIAEPDTEKVTVGAKDGFVETLICNANLIRRRVRAADLTFAMHTVGSAGKTDVTVAYLDHLVNKDLLDELSSKLDSLNVTALTMGAKSLSELLLPHRWLNPLPSIQYTQRPDVACSYLMEGHILILVDNSPLVLILPCTIFQFTQSPEDYFKSPLVGSYLRMVRFLCIPITLFLMPVFLLITAYFPEFSERWQILSTQPLGPIRLIFYVFTVEFLLDLLKYSAALSAGNFSTSLSIVGGLLIGDIAITLNWASPEVLFYGAISLLTALSISSTEFSDALRVYRIFLLITTSIAGAFGFGIGLILITISALTTPTFGGMSYFWPLFPLNIEALLTLLFRHPTANAQPSTAWNRGPIHPEK